jgi:N-acetylglutamate synthase-like GNAT family acetyltransferase
MSSFTLRPAHEGDAAVIKHLIHSVGINPMDLDWRRFIVAVDDQDKVIATGQIKPHNKGKILELASIAVVEEHRGEGLARAIIEDLLKDSPRPLYLTCRSGLQPLYRRFGFQSLTYEEMPRYYQRLSKLAGVFITITGQDEAEGLSVMKLQ